MVFSHTAQLRLPAVQGPRKPPGSKLGNRIGGVPGSQLDFDVDACLVGVGVRRFIRRTPFD